MSIHVREVRLLALCAVLTIAGCGSPLPDTADAAADGAAADSSTRIDAGPPPVDCVGGCVIEGDCVPDGTTRVENPCEVCDVSRSATAFSPNDGAVCDDGAFCTTSDVCVDRACSGAPRTCDDGIACNGIATCDEADDLCAAGTATCAGGQICDALSGECVLECSGCLIDGTCYGDGQVDALDPCRVCAVETSRSAWSDNDGASCDDGAFCTTGDACAAGVCAGAAPRACDDGVACNGAESCDETADACAAGATACEADELCDLGSDACVTTCTGCVIGGTCFGAGQRNPAQQCEVCDPATSRSAWTTNDGASCDDGLFCTVTDVCTGTACGGAARACGNGIACDGVETCDETADACDAGTAACAAGTLCDPGTDSCVTTCSGCVIGGTCFGDGQVSPTNPCQVCDVATSRTAWSDDDGARCDDGAFCTDGDVCAAGACAGTPRVCSDGVACNGAESCDETADACVAGPSTCAATQVCDTAADACVTTCAGCVIGGVCHAGGARNPANECEICDVARSRAAWSTNDGASCDDGQFCTRGDVCGGGLCAGSSADFCGDGVGCNGAETCSEATDRCVAGATTCAAGQLCDPSADACVTACDGCVIGGVCFAAGTRNPAQQCQVCAPATSATAWTASAGATCDDGLFCTVSDVCDASAVCAGAARGCDDGVTCNGAESCNEASDRCVAGASTCGTGQVCDTAADACRTTCSGCVIAGVCQAPGASNPSNPCQICNTAASTTAWSPNAGASCEDGSYCSVGDTCSATGACVGGAARDCRDAVTCNGAETCNEATDRCDAAATTCTGGRICDGATNMCVLSCVGGTSLCGTSCVNTAYDPANCGGCGMACGAAANATAVCASSACRYLCDTGFASCNATSPDCETDVRSDEANCGACGRACGASQTCVSGACISNRRVFVTSTLHDGNLGGPAGADAICQGRAVAAGLGGTWRAWISDATSSPSTRFTRSTVPYVRIDGVQVASGWADLTDGSIAAPINVTELGGPPPASTSGCSSAAVWTGTASNGTTWSNACSGWTSSSGSGLWGNHSITSSSWTLWCSGGLCSWLSPIYCFEQ